MDRTTRTPRWPFAVTLLLTLLVATGLRLYRLPELPLGLHYDEAANGILASEIARGTETPVFIPSYTGKEVLFFYWAALWMKLLGVTPLALRLSAALAGLATVAATVWAVRELLHGEPDANSVALLTAAFLATSFWHLVLSRYGFRAVTQPLMQALTVATLWRGLRLSSPPLPSVGEGEECSRSPSWLILSGLLCGLTAYTYLAARAFPIPLAAALLALLIADRGQRRARLGQMALFVAVAALALSPLAHYWLTHPGSFLNRTRQVAATSWAEAWSGIRACLGMFFLRGDPYMRFNLPRRPLFDPLTAALFLLGLATAFKTQSPKPKTKNANARHPTPRSPAPPPPRSPAPLRLATRVFLLTYLPTMLLPSALAVGDITPSNLRTAGLLPFVYLFPALGLQTIKSQIQKLKPKIQNPKPQPAIGHLSLVIGHFSLFIVHWSLVILLAFITARAYFRDWAPSAALYYAADGDLVDIATTFNETDLTATTPYIASTHYRHPTLAFLAEDYSAIRWLRGGNTVVFPATGDALLIFPRSEAGGLAWVESVLPDGALVAAPPGPDGAPAFHVYRLGPAPSDLAGQATAPGPTHSLTADLGHLALLLGYDVVGRPRSGGRAEVAVWWRVLNTPDRGDYGPVVRLTDPWGFVWGEKQPFHYPSEQWTAGEWIVDRLSIPVAPGAPPGDYAVEFSLYSPGADALLPVLDDTSRYAGTSVALPLRLGHAATPPAPDALDDLGMRDRLGVQVEGLTLLGFNLDTASARPGERLYLTLFWRAGEPPVPEYDVALTLGDTTLYAGAPVHGTYPTSGWTASEVVVDRYDPRLPRHMPPGDHPLRLHLGAPAPSAGPGLALNLDTVSVQAVDRRFDVPPISHALTATLGGQVQLLGYDLAAEAVAPGDTLTLTLYWRALVEMDQDYTVFTHLLAPNGSTAGQRDGHPVDGSYPTSLWLSGEVVADTYEIPIRADAAPGAHRLEVGMYVAETGERLPVANTPDDAVVLQAVAVTDQ